MIDIIHRVGVKAPISKVYAAISTIEGVAGWWTQETTGVSKPGGTIEFEFSTPSGEKIGGIGMEVIGGLLGVLLAWRLAHARPASRGHAADGMPANPPRPPCPGAPR